MINQRLISNLLLEKSGSEIVISYDRTRVDAKEKKGMSDFWKNILWAIVLITLLAIIL